MALQGSAWAGLRLSGRAVTSLIGGNQGGRWVRDVDGSGRIGDFRMIDSLALYYGLNLSVTFYQVPVTMGTNEVNDLPRNDIDVA